jgi:hypothetical protein
MRWLLDSLLTAVWVNKIVPAFDPGTSKRLLVSCQLNIRTEIRASGN